jgi:hypothetical protein
MFATTRGTHVPARKLLLAFGTGIGTGVASLFSALFVVKHYGFHYTTGVFATLPAGASACYLLAMTCGGRFWFRTAAAALCVIAVSWIAGRSSNALSLQLAARADKSRLAQPDLLEIDAWLAGSGQPIEFGHHSPLSWSGEGFVIYYGSVPRMNDAYAGSRQQMFGSATAGLIKRQPGTYVIDKAYFPTADSIKTAPEWRTVFLLTNTGLTAVVLSSEVATGSREENASNTDRNQLGPAPDYPSQGVGKQRDDPALVSGLSPAAARKLPGRRRARHRRRHRAREGFEARYRFHRHPVFSGDRRRGRCAPATIPSGLLCRRGHARCAALARTSDPP